MNLDNLCTITKNLQQQSLEESNRSYYFYTIDNNETKEDLLTSDFWDIVKDKLRDGDLILAYDKKEEVQPLSYYKVKINSIGNVELCPVQEGSEVFVEKKDVMPEPAEEYLGNIYQYQGETTERYTNGYFYKGISKEEYSTDVTFNPTTISCSNEDFLAFLQDKFENFADIKKGTMTYLSMGDAWEFSGKNENNEEIAFYQQYTGDFENEGFTFTGTFQDEDVVNFVCNTTSQVTYDWEDIVVQNSYTKEETDTLLEAKEEKSIEILTTDYEELVANDKDKQDTNYILIDSKKIMRNRREIASTNAEYKNLYEEGGTVDLNTIVEPGNYWVTAGTDGPDPLHTMTVVNAPDDCKTAYGDAAPTGNTYIWIFLEVENIQDTQDERLVIYQKIHSTKSGLTADYSRRCFCQGTSYDPTVDTWSPWVKNSTSREIKNYDKKIAMFGGSVAAGSLPYVFPHIEDTLGTRKLYSYAVGGAGFNAGTNFRTQIATMMSEHPTEKVDVALFWCSTNDWNNTSRGTYVDYSYYNNWGQDTSVQAATTPDVNMCSSMNYCFKTLYDYNPNIEIYVILPLRCYTRREGWDIYDNDWVNNTDGKWAFQRIVDAIKQVCSVWCIPILDLWNASGINFYNETNYLSDHLHPTAVGYNKIKYQIAEFLKNGGYGSFNPVLPHQDENIWTYPDSPNAFSKIIPCRSDDGVGNAQSNYIDLGTPSQPYYIRDGICMLSFSIIANGNITTGSTPLLRGMPDCEGGDSGGYMIQIPLICRSGTYQYSMAYAYLTAIRNTITNRIETLLVGDGLKAGCSYRGFCCYPVARR